MSLSPFALYFPELAQRETRTVFLEGEMTEDWNIPPDGYALLEHYCTDKRCDCRRVLLKVVANSSRRAVATISFGFDEGEMRGPFLDPLHEKASYADEILAVVNSVVLSDREYVARLERHYAMVKQALGAKLRNPVVTMSQEEAQQRIAERKKVRKQRRRREKAGKRLRRRPR